MFTLFSGAGLLPMRRVGAKAPVHSCFQSFSEARTISVEGTLPAQMTFRIRSVRIAELAACKTLEATSKSRRKVNAKIAPHDRRFMILILPDGH